MLVWCLVRPLDSCCRKLSKILIFPFGEGHTRFAPKWFTLNLFPAHSEVACKRYLFMKYTVLQIRVFLHNFLALEACKLFRDPSNRLSAVFADFNVKNQHSPRTCSIACAQNNVTFTCNFSYPPFDLLSISVRKSFSTYRNFFNSPLNTSSVSLFVDIEFLSKYFPNYFPDFLLAAHSFHWDRYDSSLDSKWSHRHQNSLIASLKCVQSEFT